MCCKIGRILLSNILANNLYKVLQRLISRNYAVGSGLTTFGIKVINV